MDIATGMWQKYGEDPKQPKEVFCLFVVLVYKDLNTVLPLHCKSNNRTNPRSACPLKLRAICEILFKEEYDVR